MTVEIPVRCHDDGLAYPGFLHGWREPLLDRTPYAEPFRSCAYCGSIHPVDLLTLFDAHQLAGEMADRKYGWPHKVYVDRIPNPIAGQVVRMGGRSMGRRPKTDMLAGAIGGPTYEQAAGRPATDEELEAAGWEITGDEHVTRYFKPLMGPAPHHTRAKFYTIHLTDCDPETASRVSAVIRQLTGWTVEAAPERRLRWRHP